MNPVPVVIDARRVRVLVVGGGDAAAAETAAIVRVGGAVRVVAPEPGPAIRTLAASSPLVMLDERDCRDDDVAWATLVFAAAADPAVNARLAASARESGRLVKVAGDAAASTFSTPATLRTGELVISVCAADVEPLARRIRDHVSERVGVAYARALEGLLALRTELLARGDGQRWQDAMEALLDEDACEAIERGVFERRLAAWR